MSSEALKQEIRAALDNTTLARTLGTFCKTYPAKREKAYEGVDFEATRNKISEVKRYAADHVDEMIADFTKNCEARGVCRLGFFWRSNGKNPCSCKREKC